MDDIAEDNAAAGAYIICSTRSTPNSSVANIFQARGATHLYNFQANIDSAVWDNYGYVNNLGFKVVIDRDGYIRHNNSDVSTAEAVLLECLGVS